MAAKPSAGRATRRKQVLLLVVTRKGTFLLKSDAGRRSWQLSPPHFLRHIVHHAMLDPRDRCTLLVAARAGHLEPTLFRSTSFGKTWFVV